MRRLFTLLGLVAVLTVTAWFGYFLYLHYRFVVTDNAFQSANFTAVSTEDVSGKIVKLYVKEFQRVSKGQPLFKVDDSSYRERLRQVEAQLKAVDAQIEAAKLRLSRLQVQLPASVGEAEAALSGAKASVSALGRQLSEAEANYRATLAQAQAAVPAARSALEAAKVDLERWRRRLERYRALYERRVISLQQFEDVKAAYYKALSAYRAAESRLVQADSSLKKAEALKEQVKALEARLKAVRAKVVAYGQRLKASEASLKQIEETRALLKELLARRKALVAQEAQVKLLLSHTLVRSPVSGFVAKRWKEVGDFTSPGLPVFSVYDPSSFYVLAWIDEDKVRFIRNGTEGRVELETCGRSFKARVVAVGRSAGSVFALIPRDTSQGEYTRVVQRVPVKIKVFNVPLECVKPGTNVTVYLRKR